MPTREEQLALREAFIAGSEWRLRVTNSNTIDPFARPEAEKRFPLTEKRPRVAIIGAYRYRSTGGELEYQYVNTDLSGDWYVLKSEKEKVLTLADLLAHPTEEVAL